MRLLTRFVSSMVLAAALVAGNPLPGAAKQAQLLSVIELFTSQGCSSCPPADALLERYTERDDVLALTFNVDYWDYLGWKDTLANPANSRRQRAYAKARGDRAVYTPQIVANGTVHAPGYDPGAIDAAIAASGTSLGGARIPMTLDSQDGMLKVRILDAAPAGMPRSGTVWLVLFSKQEKVAIARGENTGRDITYYNVVREMTPVGTWDGAPVKIDLPKSDVMSRGYDGCAVVLQAGTGGPILGAALLESW